MCDTEIDPCHGITFSTVGVVKPAHLAVRAVYIGNDYIKGSPLGRFPSRGSRDLWLCLEAFPRGLHTGLSHVPPWWESILSVKVEAVQGNQVSLEWTETSGGLLEWWHDARVPLAFHVESASS